MSNSGCSWGDKSGYHLFISLPNVTRNRMAQGPAFMIH